MKKRGFVILFLGFLLLLLAGCGDDHKGRKQISIGVVMKLHDEFQNKVITGAKDAAETFGCKISCDAPDNISDAMQQVEMIENFIAQEVDVLLVNPNIADAAQQVLNDAADQGIKVVLVDTNAPKFNRAVTYIGTNNYDAAVKGGFAFAERLPKGANVVIATGIRGDYNHEKRSLGFKNAMITAGCHVLDIRYCDNSADLTATQVEAWIQKYGIDGIDAVMCTDDDAAMGAVSAIQQNGATEKIKVCSFNGFQVAAQKIKEGNMEMTVAQKPYEMGYQAVVCGINALMGKRYDQYIIMDAEIMDASNCESYLENNREE